MEPSGPPRPPAPPAAAGRSSITVAASRGCAGGCFPARTSRARWPSWPPILIRPRLIPDLCDQLDLDGGVEREERHPDRASRVPARLAEHLDQQLAGAVDHLGLLSEGHTAGHEAGHLDDAHDRIKPA